MSLSRPKPIDSGKSAATSPPAHPFSILLRSRLLGSRSKVESLSKSELEPFTWKLNACTLVGRCMMEGAAGDRPPQGRAFMPPQLIQLLDNVMEDSVWPQHLSVTGPRTRQIVDARMQRTGVQWHNPATNAIRSALIGRSHQVFPRLRRQFSAFDPAQAERNLTEQQWRSQLNTQRLRWDRRGNVWRGPLANFHFLAGQPAANPNGPWLGFPDPEVEAAVAGEDGGDEVDDGADVEAQEDADVDSDDDADAQVEDDQEALEAVVVGGREQGAEDQVEAQVAGPQVQVAGRQAQGARDLVGGGRAQGVQEQGAVARPQAPGARDLVGGGRAQGVQNQGAVAGRQAQGARGQVQDALEPAVGPVRRPRTAPPPPMFMRNILNWAGGEEGAAAPPVAVPTRRPRVITRRTEPGPGQQTFFDFVGRGQQQGESEGCHRSLL
ncbi:hypothetical protein ACM66B_006046 [Microbotryomycetes sp. NB124-2]